MFSAEAVAPRCRCDVEEEARGMRVDSCTIGFRAKLGTIVVARTSIEMDTFLFGTESVYVLIF
jgi:hypothetical protein